MARLEPILEKLLGSQETFLRTADSVAPAAWPLQPGAGRWSAAELVAHLCQVERSVVGYADREIQKAPRPVSFFGRRHLPLAIVESRIFRRKVPSGLLPPVSLTGKETMIAELRGVRERTLAFLGETDGRDLVPYGWPHPFLGRFNFYDWFTFLAAHQIPHTKQLREITKNLPKGVASSRK
jgi:DinB superfamily